MIDILFVNASSRLVLNEEVNGTMLLATKLLRSGFQVKVLRFGQFESNDKDYAAFISDITERILEISPKCVSFYCLWPQYHIMLRIAGEVKKRRSDILVVFGGPQASATARDTMELMPFVDYICTGEGEDTVVPFFEAVLKNNGASLSSVPGLYYRDGEKTIYNNTLAPLCDLNALPHWDERLYLDDYRQAGVEVNIGKHYMPIDAGRGCPYSCTFCCSSHFWRRTYRLKSAQTIVDDILHYRNKYGIQRFWFSHDAFTVDKALVAQVCDKIIESGLTDITWRCSSRVDCLTEELIVKMKQAGLRDIELGIETGSPRMQKLINKNLNLEKAKQMIAFSLKNQLSVGLFFMYGFPEETEQELNETLELIFTLLDMGVQQVSMSYCRFNPQTAITEKYFDELVFDPDIQILLRTGVFGHDEEMDMIRKHKALFPFFYHLNTPVRNEFQHVAFFVELYRRYRKTMALVRARYRGDNIAFYRDFIQGNKQINEQNFEQIMQRLSERSVEMADNMLCICGGAGVKQLRAILQFESDCYELSRSKEDKSLQRVYEFSYIEFKKGLPAQLLSDSKTELLLQKKNGKMDMKILSIE